MLTTRPVTRAQGRGNVVALTIDDGPNGQVTGRLLDFLADRGVRATFCLVGANILSPGGGALVRRMVTEGHVLGNHGMSYDDMGGWSSDRVEADLRAVLGAFSSALVGAATPVPFFRAPNGNWGCAAEVAVRLGMQPLGVCNAIDDWLTQDADILTENLRRAMRPGQVVVVHDGGGTRYGTLRAVEAVVDERLSEGWRFTVPVGAEAPCVCPRRSASSPPNSPSALRSLRGRTGRNRSGRRTWPS